MSTADVLLEIGKYLTGGLAGAALTAVVGKRRERKLAKRLTYREARVDYALPNRQSGFHQVKVAYDGEQYNRLSYYALRFTNGEKAIPHDVPITFILSPHADVRDHEVVGEPLPVDATVVRSGEGGKELLKIVLPPFSPKNAVEIRMIVDGECQEWHYHGCEDIAMVPEASADRPPFDFDVRMKETIAKVGFAIILMLMLLLFLREGVLLRFVAKQLFQEHPAETSPAFPPSPTP